MKPLAKFFFITFSLAILFTGAAASKDITALIKMKTDIDQQLRLHCDSLAAGNEKKCWLKSVDFDLRLQTPTSVLKAVVALQSKHVPFANAVLYDNTAYIDIQAEIDNNDCHVTDVKITSSNEIYKILLSVVADRIKSAIRRVGSICDF